MPDGTPLVLDADQWRHATERPPMVARVRWLRALYAAGYHLMDDLDRTPPPDTAATGVTAFVNIVVGDPAAYPASLRHDGPELRWLRDVRIRAVLLAEVAAVQQSAAPLVALWQPSEATAADPGRLAAVRGPLRTVYGRCIGALHLVVGHGASARRVAPWREVPPERLAAIWLRHLPPDVLWQAVQALLRHDDTGEERGPLLAALLEGMPASVGSLCPPRLISRLLGHSVAAVRLGAQCAVIPALPPRPSSQPQRSRSR